MAIQGRGYFQILRTDGSLGYSRDGSFQVDSQGQVVTSNGYLLQPTITIPASAQSITIGEDGVVSVMESGNTAATQVGTIQLADFVNPAGLQPAGQNLFLETSSSGAAQLGTPGLEGLGAVAQGALETSNVNVVEEMVNMIETQRAYEINSKAISTADQMLQYINNNI
jgi:flagellar basal-body rod protein FlgG